MYLSIKKLIGITDQSDDIDLLKQLSFLPRFPLFSSPLFRTTFLSYRCFIRPGLATPVFQAQGLN
jgi:hypothetical protein